MWRTLLAVRRPNTAPGCGAVAAPAPVSVQAGLAFGLLLWAGAVTTATGTAEGSWGRLSFLDDEPLLVAEATVPEPVLVNVGGAAAHAGRVHPVAAHGAAAAHGASAAATGAASASVWAPDVPLAREPVVSGSQALPASAAILPSLAADAASEAAGWSALARPDAQGAASAASAVAAGSDGAQPLQLLVALAGLVLVLLGARGAIRRGS